MRRDRHHTSQNGGAAPATPGFTAVAPEWIDCGAAEAAPAIPAAESTLGSHPCVALSSAQVLPEWINRNLAANAFASNGDNPLNFVSRFRGSLQSRFPPGSHTSLDISQKRRDSHFSTAPTTVSVLTNGKAKAKLKPKAAA
jgi:hypothetical protein